MTDLERFAAILLAELRAEGARPEVALAVGSILDRTFPYKVARRTLRLDSAEDYEAMVLRLIAEEGGVMATEPVEAAEMARTTLATKIPDLDVLRLLRSAMLTFTEDALSRLDGVRVLPQSLPPEPPAAPVEEVEPDASPPVERERVFPIRRHAEVADATRVAAASAPPAGDRCWSCGAEPPSGRQITYCVACGADQRPPTCDGCGTGVERSWKHCPDCGHALGGGA